MSDVTEAMIERLPLAAAMVRRFRQLPLEGDAGCDKLTDAEWRLVAEAAFTAMQQAATPAAPVRATERDIREANRILREKRGELPAPVQDDDALGGGGDFGVTGEWWGAVQDDDAITSIRKAIQRALVAIAHNRPSVEDTNTARRELNEARDALARLTPDADAMAEAERLKAFLSKPYDGGSDNHGS